MATVKHYLVICVPRQNRAEVPVPPEDSGVFRYLTEKTYLRKYFKVCCIGYTNWELVSSLIRASFKNGVFIKDVSRSMLSYLDISPLPYADFLEYCNASMLRSHLDGECSDFSTGKLTPVYTMPSVLNFDTDKYAEALMTNLCDCFSFHNFFNAESLAFAIPSGICIVNPEEHSAEFGLSPDCFVDKEYRDKVFGTYNRYISDCEKLSLFSRQDTVVCHEDDKPDDDDFNACFAEYEECLV